MGLSRSGLKIGAPLCIKCTEAIRRGLHKPVHGFMIPLLIRRGGACAYGFFFHGEATERNNQLPTKGTIVLFRGTIVNRTYGIHKNLYI